MAINPPLGDIFSLGTVHFSIKYVIVGFVFLCLALHFVKFIIYNRFGWKVSILSIFKGQLSGIVYSGSTFSISIASIKIRINWFKRKKQFLLIALSDIEVELISSANSQNSTQNPHINNSDGAFSSESEDCLYFYPRKPWKKRIVSLLLRHIPDFTIFTKTISVSYRDRPDLQVRCNQLSLRNTFDRFPATPNSSAFRMSLALEIDRLCLEAADHFTNETIIQRITFEAPISLDLEHGFVSEISPKLVIHSMKVPCYRLLVLVQENIEFFKIKILSDRSQPQAQDKVTFKDRLEGLLGRVQLLKKLLSKVEFLVNDLSFDCVPMIHYDNFKLVQSPTFLQDNNVILFNFGFKSMNVYLTRLQPTDTGYDIHFDRPAKPLRLMITLLDSVIEADFANNGFSKSYDLNCCKLFELLRVPNVNLTTHLSGFSEAFRFLEPGMLSNTQWLSNLIVSNPIIDVGTDQLASIIRSLFDLRRPSQNREDDNLDNKMSILKYFSSLSNMWPYLSLNLLIRDPMFVLKRINMKDNMTNLVIASISIVELDLESVREIDLSGTLSYEMVLNMKAFGSKIRIDNKVFDRLKSREFSTINDYLKYSPHSTVIARVEIATLKGHLKVIPKLDCKSEISIVTPKLTLPKLAIFDGFCSIIDDLRYNFHREMMSCHSFHVSDDENNAGNDSILFCQLPKWFSSVRISISDFYLLIASRSLLIPKDMTSQLYIEDVHDYVDRSLRQVSVYLSRFDAELVKSEMDSGGGTSPLKSRARTSSDDDDSDGSQEFFDSEDNKNGEPLSDIKDHSCCWKVDIKLSSFSSTIHHENQKGDALKRSRICTIDELFIQAKSIKPFEGTPFVKFHFKFGHINAHLTLTALFILISAINLVKATMIRSFMELCKKKGFTNLGESPDSQRVNFGDKIVLHCLVNCYRVKLGMSNDFNTLVDGNKLKVVYDRGQRAIIKNTLFRLHVESPAVKGYWAKFVSIQRSTLTIHLNELFSSEDSNSHILDGSNLGLRINVPNQFVFHQLFDNIITSSKVVRHLLLSLNSDSTENILRAHPTEPLKLPNCKFSSSRLVLTMDDDPFEAELGMIFKLGLIEQKARLAKRKSFNEMARVYLNPADDTDIDLTIDRIEFELADRLDFATNSFDTQSPQTESFHGDKTFEMKKELRSKLYRLQKQISLAWISIIKLCKSKMKETIAKNSKFLYGPLGDTILSDGFNSKLISESIDSPLVTLILETPTIIIRKPTFSSLTSYLYQVGKGLPPNTQYGLLVPMNLNISISELRIHLKDYPLPMLYIPKSRNSDTLKLSGNLVIAEQYFDGPASLRNVYVPLVSNAIEKNNGKFYSLTLLKTIASVKLITELSLSISGTSPTKINWCISYKAAIQQVMMNLDAFSKPQLDPSPKIGFWDKVRSILHGKLIVNFDEDSSLHFCIKGSRSPYELLNESAGFVLVFEENICLTINKDNKSTELITVEAGKVLWGIPNHLTEPLLVWCADTKNSIFLPTSKAFITDTVYYFFLNSITENDKPVISKLKNEYFEKINIKLAGQVRFVVGFMFERVGDDGKRTTDFLPHYKVVMNNPDFIDNPETYDAYKGFRSDFIHLTISLRSNEASEHSRNSIHLSPGTFNLFFKWWKLFNGVLALPIRNGKLFNTQGKSQKFSDYLYTIKYQFLIEPLYIAHVYREGEREFLNEGTIGTIGLLGKVDKFVVDLHQRKEAVLKENLELELSEEIFKMRMYLGEASLDSLDLRVNQALFAKQKERNDTEADCYDEDGEEKVKIFVHDNDTRWFDYDDYNECNISSLKNRACAVKILPLLSSTDFKYFRDTDNEADSYANPLNSPSIGPFGNEPSHNCLINSSEQAELASDATKGEKKSKDVKFNNEFIVKDMLLKWTCEGRNLVLKYIHEVSFMKEKRSVLCYEAFSKVQKIVERNGIENSHESSCGDKGSLSTANTDLSEKLFDNDEEYLSCEESVRSFFQELRKIKLTDENKEAECNQDYLVKLISPQIQLITHPQSDTMMLVTTPLIELQIISLGEISTNTDDSDSLGYKNIKLETRYGTVLNNANVFCLQKSQVESDKIPRHVFKSNSYGSMEIWPPFLSVKGMEHEAMLDLQLLEDTSMVIRYDRINRLLRSNESKNDKLSVDIPNVVTSVNSKEYLSFYKIIMELLLYVEPINKKMHEKIHKFVLATDFSNLKGISNEIIEKHQMLNALRDVTQNYYFRKTVLKTAESLELQAIEKAAYSLTEQLFLLVKVILTGGSSILDNKEALEWRIQADSLLVTMLDVDQKPFVAMSIENVLFRRLNYDERYYNLLEVDKMSAYNLEDQVYFPELLAPMKQNEDDKAAFIRVQWEMDKNVAGIQVFKRFDTQIKPFRLQLEQELGEKLMEYIFPAHDPKVFKTNSNFQEFTDLQKELYQLSSEDGGTLFQEYPTSEEDDIVGEDASTSFSTSGSSSFDDSNSTTVASTCETKPDSSETKSISASNDYLSVMSYRAETFSVFNSIKIQDLTLTITFRGVGVLRLINVSDFVFRVPDLELTNKIWTLLDLVNYLERAVLKALLRHTGSLLGNKLKIKKRRKRIPSIRKNLAKIRNM